VKSIVASTHFEHMAALAVVVNGVILGVETNVQALHGAEASIPLAQFFETFFCVAFTTELGFRLVAHGFDKFYTGDGWQWSFFDTVLVGILLMDQAAHMFFETMAHLKYISSLRILRVFRIVRITRALRMFHLFDALKVIVDFLTQSLYPAIWASSFFMLFIYIFAVLVLQMAMTMNNGDIGVTDGMQHWFGNLGRACLTLFECAVGGTEWEQVASTLNTDVSPTMRIFFIIYVTVSMFVTVNLMLSVFMEMIVRRLREDLDPDLARRVDAVFRGVQGELTWAEFSAQLETPAIRDYLKSIDVYPDPQNAKAIFEIIDVDGGGTLSSEELIDGALRLQGPGRALESAMILKATSQIIETTSQILEDLEIWKERNLV
jgi:hypothetical protein